MARQAAPLPQFQFGGIVATGHPLRRPPNSAVKCMDFRIMPGNYPRLRGGRDMFADSTGSFLQFYQFQKQAGIGGVYHLVRRETGGQSWASMNIGSFPYAFTSLEPISNSYGFNSPSVAAIATLRDKVVFDNGLGVRGGAGSQPALSSWDGTQVRYVGLDCWVNGTEPTVTFTHNPSGTSKLSDFRTLYVGLYNTKTGHFSNGYKIGRVSPSPIFTTKIDQVITGDPSNPQNVKVLDSSRIAVGDNLQIAGANPETVIVTAVPDPIHVTAVFTLDHVVGDNVTDNDPISIDQGDIVVSNISGISAPYHAGGEATELKLVFYSTLDGGETPFLVLLSDGSGPFTKDIGSASASFDLNAIDGTGMILDDAQEMPRANFPPRSMSCACYANGRIYYSLRKGGSGGPTPGELAGKAPAFDYNVTDRDLPAVFWTAAADDLQNRDFTGVPEESFPPLNKKYTPNGEIPLLVQPADDRGAVIVVTTNGTYILSETADGLHEWSTISAVEGMYDPASFVKTPYGMIWFTQKKRIVILEQNAITLTDLSRDYSPLLAQVTSAIGDYLLDPQHQIDRYELWINFSPISSVIHDFYLGGKCYTTSGQDATACKSVLDAFGQTHHMMAIGSRIFTHEANPFTRIVPVTDQVDAINRREINGDYIGQWQDYRDSETRKEVEQIDIIGDGYISTQLGKSPLSVSWYPDLVGLESFLNVVKTNQSQDDDMFRAKLERGKRFWYKFRFRLSGHSQDAGATYYSYLIDGDLTPNQYGAIWATYLTISEMGQNRP